MAERAADGRAPMQFTRLKLSGFKSFVEPAELRIEPGLTGVVGPNGCGKSNLLEAIRWVMGEGSARSLRGGGMDDVIFAGTARRPARDFAEVMLSAQTDPSGPYGGELEVVRRIERGAGSAYRVNGRDVRAKDVALVFADAATGAHSPALVSQGRIAAVIAARGASSALSAASAAVDHMRDWALGTNNNDGGDEDAFVSMGVFSDGTSGYAEAPEGVVFSFPVRCAGDVSEGDEDVAASNVSSA